MERWEAGKSYTVEWSKYKSYKFKVEKVLNKSFDENGVQVSNKQVVEGYFVNDAPEGVESGCCCIFKKIWIPEVKGEYDKYPQARERYDLIDYSKITNKKENKESNLRNILAQNETASAICNTLIESNTYDDTGVECYIVESRYAQLPENKSTIIESMTVWERLEFVLQYANGLKELQSCKIGDKHIVAQRDVKVDNGLIKRGEESFCVKIIDFSTIRLGDVRSITEDYNSGTKNAVVTGTVSYPLSPENTAPEDVLNKTDDGRAWIISEKRDVLALGALMAGFFGYVSDKDGPTAYRNPYQFFNVHYGSWEENGGASITKALQPSFIKGEGFDKNGESWVEIMLQDGGYSFNWKDATDTPYKASNSVRNKIRELFISATHVFPDERINLDEFIAGVKYIMSCVDKERNMSNPYLYKKEEAAYVFNQSLSNEEKAKMRVVSRGVFLQENSWVKCFSYTNCETDNKDKIPQIKKPTDESITSLSKLDKWITKLEFPGRNSTNNGNSLLSVLRTVGNFYYFNRDMRNFNGIIHIFTDSPVVDKHLEDYKILDKTANFSETVTFNAVIDKLKRAVSDKKELIIYVHSDFEPRLEKIDNSLFTHIPGIPEFEHKPEVPKPDVHDKQFVTNKSGLTVVYDGETYYVSQIIMKRG